MCEEQEEVVYTRQELAEAYSKADPDKDDMTEGY